MHILCQFDCLCKCIFCNHCLFSVLVRIELDHGNKLKNVIIMMLQLYLCKPPRSVHEEGVSVPTKGFVGFQFADGKWSQVAEMNNEITESLSKVLNIYFFFFHLRIHSPYVNAETSHLTK